MEEIRIRVSLPTTEDGCEHARVYEIGREAWGNNDECEETCRELCNNIGNEILEYLMALRKRLR